MPYLAGVLLILSLLLHFPAHANSPLAPVGSAFTYKVTSDNGNGTETWTRLTDDTLHNIPAARLHSRRTYDDGGSPLELVLYHELTSGSWMAAKYNGIIVDEALPHNGQFSLPLHVGKRWVQTHRREQGPIFADVYTVTGTWEVVAYEDVTVPAGIFRTYKIIGTSDIEDMTIWLSVELGAMIKANINRKVHFEVPGQTVYELTAYNRP